MPVRHRSDQPLAASAAAVKTGHLGRQPGLVEKHEAGRIHVALPDPPAVSPIGNIGTVLLGRPQALFLNRSPEPAQAHMDCRQAHRYAALLSQFIPDLGQGDVGPFTDQRPQQLLMRQ